MSANALLFDLNGIATVYIEMGYIWNDYHFPPPTLFYLKDNIVAVTIISYHKLSIIQVKYLELPFKFQIPIGT